MPEANNNKHLNDYDDEIDLRKLFYILWEGKWTIVSVTTFISILGVIYSLLLPNIYESKTLLVPVNPSSGISSSLGGFNSSLAGFAGLGLPQTSSKDNSAKALKKISSLSFFENNIMTNIHLPDLMAAKSWNSATNTIAFDENIYNINTNTWIREVSYPMQQKPTAQESFKVFKSKHLTISQDKKTGFITLSIKHLSPFTAKQWAELVVNEVNNFYRKKDKLESEKAVSYLNQQILKTDLSEIKQVLAQLLQEETKKLVLVEANQFYVFDYVDPPAVMELKSEPQRAIICIFIALFGGMLSIILVLVKHYVFSDRDS